jgi:endonuclease/exonuclease/phosphatase family metal-dependent hydrolase
MMRKWRACLAAAGLLAATFTVHTATPAAADARYTFLQFNMSGHMNHGGATDVIVPAVVNSITSSWPTAVSLNEVCEDQYAEILWHSNVAGGGYNAHFAETWPEEKGFCGGGQAFGIALLLRGDNPGGLSVHPLPSEPGSEQRKLICGNTGLAGHPTRLGVCSSHLAPGDGNPDTPSWKHAQMKYISDTVLIPYAQAGNAMAFMGDTYLNEAEMRFSTAGLYAHTAVGNTKTNPECRATAWAKEHNKDWAKDCEDGELTHQYDYVMVSINRSHSRSGAITRTLWSDHLPVRGSATFR